MRGPIPSIDPARVVINVLAAQSGRAVENISHEMPLGEGGLELDSFAVLEAVLEIEQRANLELRQGTLDEDALGTVGGLVRFVSSNME